MKKSSRVLLFVSLFLLSVLCILEDGQANSKGVCSPSVMSRFVVIANETPLISDEVEIYKTSILASDDLGGGHRGVMVDESLVEPEIQSKNAKTKISSFKGRLSLAQSRLSDCDSISGTDLKKSQIQAFVDSAKKYEVTLDAVLNAKSVQVKEKAQKSKKAADTFAKDSQPLVTQIELWMAQNLGQSKAPSSQGAP